MHAVKHERWQYRFRWKWPDMYKVPKIGSWEYFCNTLRKDYCNCNVFYSDAEHSDNLWRSNHAHCYLFLGCYGQKWATLLDHGTLESAIYISRMNR